MLRSELAAVRLQEFTSGQLERFRQAKVADYALQTVNHLRRFVLTAFNCARRAGRWMGPNPASDVRQGKVHRRAFDYLRSAEVPRMLAALHARWRPLFATAVYSGLRRSELFGLRKRDVDLESGLLTVARSGDRDTTKGGHADTIPIASELNPHLAEAVATSPSALVFPHVCAPGCAAAKRCSGPGGLMRADVALEGVLRRSLARAGIVEAYRHVCRRKGCTEVVEAPDSAIRRCSVHGAKLWPKPRVRPIRFHDLRHMTASLLLQAGAPHAVQLILRHRDPGNPVQRIYATQKRIRPGTCTDSAGGGQRNQSKAGRETAGQARVHRHGRQQWERGSRAFNRALF